MLTSQGLQTGMRMRLNETKEENPQVTIINHDSGGPRKSEEAKRENCLRVISLT